MATKWDGRFLALAEAVALWSKDDSRKVGCVIVGPERDVRAVGFNGFPRGVDDDVPERRERPAKYSWTEHAERNAIYNAARTGVPLAGCTAYLPWFPCMDCARAIAQSGITALVCGQRPDLNDPKWGGDFKTVPVLLSEAGVELRFAEDRAIDGFTTEHFDLCHTAAHHFERVANEVHATNAAAYRGNLHAAAEIRHLATLIRQRTVTR